jgi:hypothetical protein
MNNNQLKKQAAEEFNKKRQKRLDLEQDKINNPEKYRHKSSYDALRHAMLWATIAAAKQ